MTKTLSDDREAGQSGGKKYMTSGGPPRENRAEWGSPLPIEGKTFLNRHAAN